jgi:hypothetical protein
LLPQQCPAYRSDGRLPQRRPAAAATAGCRSDARLPQRRPAAAATPCCRSSAAPAGARIVQLRPGKASSTHSNAENTMRIGIGLGTLVLIILIIVLLF